MAENTLVLCGGTGAHVGVAFLRLHSLGYALGFFRNGDRASEKNLAFPEIYLIDQDAGDGLDGERTAWQEVCHLIDHHPGRLDWKDALGRDTKPVPIALTPLPVGEHHDWFRPPFNTLRSRFGTSPLLPLLTSKRQRDIQFSQGMMASPALGALLFELKKHDERGPGIPRDESYGALFNNHGRYVVAGSGCGGTGASVGPTLARLLARHRKDNQVLATMLLSWFELDEEDKDPERRRNAQLRNRLLRENAHSALEYYGQSLAQDVAVLPLGMPSPSLLRRRYTTDAGQPIQESFLHATAALAAHLHLRRKEGGFANGFYLMGAVDPALLAGSTPIPGGTLQDLANQASTLHEILDVTQAVLTASQQGRFLPALLEEIRPHGDPQQVASELAREATHFKAQLDWMERTLGIRGSAYSAVAVEAASRHRLRGEQQHLEVREAGSPTAVALAVFQWAARWVQDLASAATGLQVPPALATQGAHLPPANPGRTAVAARQAGELTRVPDASLGEQLQAYVDPQYLSANGWPHPLCAVDFFRRAIERGDARAVRQLQLLLVGVVSGQLNLVPVALRDKTEAVSLERLIADFRSTEGWEGIARYAVTDPRRGGEPLGFTSPLTLLCPVPFMGETEDNEIWSELWQRLSGSPDRLRWVEAEQRTPWLEDTAVCRLLAWRTRQIELWGTDTPPWLRVLDSLAHSGMKTVYGNGESIAAFWGSSVRSGQRRVELALPSSHIDDRWEPPAGTLEISDNELLRRVPELLSFLAPGESQPYTRIELELPDQPEPVYGIWEAHLLELQRLGKILAFGVAGELGLRIGLLQEGRLEAALLANTRLLSRRTIQVEALTPLEQAPVANHRTGTLAVRYPDLPIRAAYLDLVLPERGDSSLLALARLGERMPTEGFSPRLERDAAGRRWAAWPLRLRGLPHPLEISVMLRDSEPHRAHWLVWPRFRSIDGSWRAYYLYEDCTDPRLSCDVLWLEPHDGAKPGRLRQRVHRESDARAYPLAFDTTLKTPSHTGGPPLALALRSRTGEEQGLYLVPLEILPRATVRTQLGIDFGTSHSVAGYRQGNEEVRSLTLTPEIGAARPLSLAISENAQHVSEALSASAAWLPTYRERLEPVLPSELLLVRSIEAVKASNPASWVPLQDFTIPPIDVTRQDLGDYLLTDFKWDAGSASFLGREPALREHYLGLLAELFLAELVQNRLKVLPERAIDLTFTYPLRSAEAQLQALRGSLERVIARSRASLGLELTLFDGLGLYDESRAARNSDLREGEVTLVADLGGGTLDLFIAGSNPLGKALKEVADSVRLGGNLLLRRMANRPDRYLPSGGGWEDATETKLRSWIRALGSHRLFGFTTSSSVRASLAELNLQGFSQPAHGDRARHLLDRYFRLVVEYMARQLVGYLVHDWFPNAQPADYPRLRLSVQLRGNGWRLSYRHESVQHETERIQELVRQRLIALWPSTDYPVPSDPEHWAPAEAVSLEDLKAAPIRRAVGQSMAFDEAQHRGTRYALADFAVLRKTSGRQEWPWHTAIPFDSSSSHLVELQGVVPPIPLTQPEADHRYEIRTLTRERLGLIHRELQQAGNVDPSSGQFAAPIAPIVWETVFQSEELEPLHGEPR